MIIYKTTNLINGKIYIGKDSRNNSKYLGSGIILNQAIKKYGRENFKKEIIEECIDKKDLNDAEQFWILNYQSQNRNIGYNITKGGDGTISIDYPDEIRKKISNSRKGKVSWNKGLTKETDERVKQYGEKRKNAPSKKKQIPWNKGLTKETDKRVKSISEKNKKQKSLYLIWLEKYGQEIAEQKQKELNTKKSINSKGEKNHMYKKSLYDIWFEKYGKEIADQKEKEWKRKMLNRIPWNKGLTKETDERVK